MVVRYLSSREKPGIDNELVERSSDNSFPVFVLIDLSSRPYPFLNYSSGVSPTLPLFLLYFLGVQFITDRVRRVL